MFYPSFFSSSDSQKRWISCMKQKYSRESCSFPCVLQVPESLRDTKREAYVPQMIGLGPYHHFRPEVQPMEREKHDAVISYLKYNNISDDIASLVEKFPDEYEAEVRSCYDKFLDLDKDALAWVVYVDGLFLLHFMLTYLGKNKEEDKKIYSNIKALIPDILMLENQIPIILMVKLLFLLDKSCAKGGVKAKNIPIMKEGIHKFCVEQSPLLQSTMDEGIKEGVFDQNNHMLHYMYELSVKNQSKTDGKDSQDQKDGGSSQGQTGSAKETGAQAGCSSQGQTDSTRGVGELGIETEAQAGGSSQGQRASTSKAGDLAKEIGLQAGQIFELAMEEFNTALAEAKLAGLKVSGNVEKVLTILRNVQKALHLDDMKGSLGDQIDIPSASRLNAILKLKFEPLPDNCGIGNIVLEEDHMTLHLPVITLNSNSEVILRNLLAYESTFKMRSTKLRDYMDLICGIIKSEKDVVLLRKKEIIKGELPDAEIVRMCNGIKKSDEKSDETSKVRKIVENMKEKFNNKRTVKACKSTMQSFAASVKFFKPVFAILVLLFLALQSFCELYDCRRSSYGGAALRNSYLGEMESDPKAKLMPPRKIYSY